MNQSEIINLFPRPIYKASINDRASFDAIATFLMNMYQDFKNSGEDMNSNNHTSGDAATMYVWEKNLQDHPLFATIVDEIESHIKQYWEHLRYSPDFTPYIHNMWANVVNTGGNQNEHNHGAFPLAGVFYISLEEDMGDFYFIEPDELLISQQPINEQIWGSVFRQSVKNTTGDLMIFPGWMKHGTEKNKTNKPRIAVGFDVTMYKQTNSKSTIIPDIYRNKV